MYGHALQSIHGKKLPLQAPCVVELERHIPVDPQHAPYTDGEVVPGGATMPYNGAAGSGILFCSIKMPVSTSVRKVPNASSVNVLRHILSLTIAGEDQLKMAWELRV